MRYAALLRGINLGSQRKVAMVDLRDALEEMGLTEIRTHLQSGNAVFTAEEVEPLTLRARLEEALADSFEIDIPVVLVSQPEMVEIVDGCPYQAEGKADPTKVHVTFLDDTPSGSIWETMDADEYLPDEFVVGQRVIYLHLPNGMARTKLPGRLERAMMGVTATTRNWRTVLAVADLLSSA